MISAAKAKLFAEKWVAAWNSHSLPIILSHYTEDFVMHSPRIREIAQDPSGVLSGKQNVAKYWTSALELQPDLKFTLINAFAGVGSAAILYQNQRGGHVCEVVFFDDDGSKVKSAHAIYAETPKI